MNTHIEHTRGTVCTIEEIMSIIREEDKDTLLHRIEYLLYNCNESDINDLHEELVGYYTTDEKHVPYNEDVEDHEDDDIDPAGGRGLHSHI